jgi:anti-anti-sigma regulatory factor
MCPFIDATGLHRLKDIMRTMERRMCGVALTDVVPEVERALRDSGIPLEVCCTLEFRGPGQ